MKEKALQDLNLMDKFLFDEAIENTELMTTVLEIILGRDIVLKSLPQTEKELRDFTWSKQVRLDVLSIDEDDNFYATEVQQENTYNLPKRSRNYQAMIDRKQMKPGQADYSVMTDVYVIMIMSFDLFGKGLYKYTFREYCQEDMSIALNTGATKIFLNTAGTNRGDASDELIALLKYFQNTTRETAEKAESEKILRMHEKIETIRKDEEVGVRFMQRWEEELMWKKEGHDLGVAEGEIRGKSIGLEEGKSIGLEEGKSIGLEEGKSIGLAEGKNIGLEEGETIGRRAERLETAAKMKANGMPLEDISKYTGLTMKEIEEIKN